MRLLVSVMDPGEVGPAAAGGADIIDVKDPSRGPLGRPQTRVVRAVRAALPPTHLMSVALGDARTFSDTLARAARAVAAVQVDFIKVGLVGSRRDAASLLRRLVEVTGEANPRTRVVAVAYADARWINAVSPFLLPTLAATAGAHGIMLDTAYKDGTSLLTHLQVRSLSIFVALARSAGLSVGLAGSLGAAEVERLQEVEPDIIGVRGAVCRHGRVGKVEATLVRRLSQVIRCHSALSGVSVSHSSPDGSAFEK